MSNQADEQIAKLVRGAAPWIVWLFVLPFGAVTLAILKSKTDAPLLVTGGLVAITLVLARFIWKVTSSRNPVGRVHHLANMLLSMGWLTVTVHRGWQGIDDPGLAIYAIGGLALCLMWNIRYSTHSDPVLDVLPRDDSGYGGRRKEPKYFDGQALVRVFATRVPAVRATAERVGTVVPVARRPWQTPTIVAADGQAALPAGPAGPAGPKTDMRLVTLALLRNWKDYTTHKNPQLNGARMKIRDAKPWRVKTVVIGVRGVHVPKMIEDSRPYLSSQMALGPADVIVKAHPKQGHLTYVDFVLENVLEAVRHWPGPTAVGKSIGEAPTVIGVYEDQMQAELLEAAVSETLAKRLGISPKNLSHLIGEGMTGSGKALSLDTPVPTPNGWTTMGALKVGDVVFGSDGQPVTVANAWPVRHGQPCYSITFSDDSSVVADIDHQWLVRSHIGPRVVTTGQMFNEPQWHCKLANDPQERRIIDITSVASRPVRCIAVNAADHLFLVGPTRVPTHNSNVARITITDGATRLDVVEWVIDTVKKYQTLGCCAEAIDWFATKVNEAQAQVRFLVKVIGERANYLGMHGYDNWEPGCGLPLLRVTIEEGGIIANELEKLDAVLNSARSAGVVIRVSFQRAHHAVVDTNVRGAFGSTMSFGCKNSEDIFAMSDELLHAGADPSQWSDRQPGMLYWSAAGIDFERQLMPLRSFKIDASVCTETIAAHVATREAWIRANCPDWFALLDALDGGNGAYSRRTTGAAVHADMVAAQARRAGRTTAQPDAAPAPAYSMPGQFAGTGTDNAQVIDMTGRPRHNDNGRRPYGDDGDVVDAEIITPPWPAQRPDEEDDDMPHISLEELDLTPQQIADMAEDHDIDPRSPIPPLPEDEDFAFPPRPPGVTLPKEQALGVFIGYLAAQGVGWEFRPRDLYPVLVDKLGKSPEWFRATALPELVAKGLVEHDRAEGRYTVTEKIQEAS
jgi:hypothetical protein